jgi:hypothetical protein
MDLCLLFGAEFESIEHAVETLLPRLHPAAPLPSLIKIQGQGARGEAEDKY